MPLRFNVGWQREDSPYMAVRKEQGMTAEQYRALLDVDFGDVELGSLTDISKIRIDKEQPLKKRRQQYLKKVGNPYLVRVGNMKVKVRFADNGVSMEEAFENMLLSV